jgi:GTP-binding protein Era
MVIGKQGRLIAVDGKEARADLEVLFGASVYLDLRVKVEKDWQRRETTLDRLGF